MATRATDTLRDLAAGWERLFPSAKLSGIVGDTRHAKRGGYHISIEDQVRDDDYSVIRPDDKAPPGKWPRDCASAVDMNLSLPDMKVCHARLVAVWRARATDPRARYINAHNGWNGSGSPGRYDWVTSAVSTASDDHEWHVHLEIRRRYVNDPQAAKAVLSILRGESPAQYLGREDDMGFFDEKQIDGRTGAQLVKDVWWLLVKGNPTTALYRSLEQLGADLGEVDVDEAAIVTGVLAGLTPEAIAAAIPPALTKQVADELGRRLMADAAPIPGQARE
ncbi:hypothetical protein ACN267_31440 [Micromonospora sp. WMMD734]|uniref:hypothetical protein n=1 Tax=Micromonospora sp. WMMD734 TaxID=3404129 RepID=UPI003B94A6B5